MGAKRNNWTKSWGNFDKILLDLQEMNIPKIPYQSLILSWVWQINELHEHKIFEFFQFKSFSESFFKIELTAMASQKTEIQDLLISNHQQKNKETLINDEDSNLI